MKDEARRVTEFMSTVSHELRTPITSIKGYIDLLRTGAVGPLTDKQKQFLDVISTNIERMTVLINDLLYVSRIDTGRLHLNMQEVNAVDLINEVAAKFQTEIENNRLSLKIEIADHLPQLHIDYQRIDQVLTNLMSNACKYTAPGGEITMSATPCYDEVSGMCLTVKDTGYGIAKEDQARLFTRFFRSHDQQVRSTHGTGLGLAISKTIVEAHRGKLTVDSELGKGSAFTVFLPL
jgi:signal transduction histidine kinase